MINNNYVLRYHGNTSNIYVGVGAGNNNSTNSNVFVGLNTGGNSGTGGVTSLRGSANTFVGHLAGALNDGGFSNSFFGDSAGYNNTGPTSVGAGNSGFHNTFIGGSAGFSNITGNSNTFVGMDAGHSSTNNYNTMVGRNAGYFNQNLYNCYFGKDAGFYDRGQGNCFYGHHSGLNSGNVTNTNTSYENSFFGHLSGVDLGEGVGNCFFGSETAGGVYTGSFNIYIGNASQTNGVSGLINSIAIGSSASANSDNKFILGNNEDSVGIGLSDDVVFLGPRNSLEINSDVHSTEISGVTGSGLQFRQLYSTCTLNSESYWPPYGKVLTVDDDGNVKLTEGGGIPFAECSSAPYLPNDIATHLDNNRIYFEGNGTTSTTSNDMINAIGIGYNCDEPLRGKLSVYQNASLIDGEETTAGYFQNQSDEYGGGAYKRGIWAVSNGFSDNQYNIGGDFFADSSTTVNIGVQGTAGEGSKDYYVGSNVGGQFFADHSDFQNIAVLALADNSTGSATLNYGIWALAPHPTGGCTASPGCNNAAGYFTGDVFVTGGTYKTSDSNLKDNIQ
jgi:hypothetical protein